MVGMFIFGLFLLNIITIFAVIVLFSRQNRLFQMEKDQKAMLSEMEELMTGYLMEMKEENDALLERLANHPQKSSKAGEEHSPIVASKQLPVLNGDESNKPIGISLSKKQAVNAYKSQSPAPSSLQEQDVETENIDVQGESASHVEREQTSFASTLQASLHGHAIPEPSFQQQVLALKQQGLSTEDIAKQLKRGKTEIELLLKFQSDN